MGRREKQQRVNTTPFAPPCEHLPQIMRRVWQKVWNDERCKNLSLLIDRYAPWKERNGMWDLRMRYKRGQREEEATGQGAKGLWLRNDDAEMIDAPISPNSRIDGTFLEALEHRHNALLGWYRQRYGQDAVRQFEATPVWRFVVGLGAAHVLETSITLHRLFGLPIIPASGLKGAARAYALCNLATELGVPILSPEEAAELNSHGKETPLQKLEKLAEVLATETNDQKQQAALDELREDEHLPADAQMRGLDLETLRSKLLPFTEIFGTTGQAGKIVFLDAIPLEVPKFTLDIMNPHYPEYYRTEGGEAPSDWQSPKPVFFLTVSETPYLFAIVARTKDSVSSLATAERWLKGALKELGIGAKTSADYGYWKVVGQ